MEMSLVNIFFAGYILIGCFFNVLALFISSFYKRRLHQSSPQIGFIVATISSITYLVLILFKKYGGNNNLVVSIVGTLSLIVFGVISSYSILSLYFVMRSVRK